MKFKTHCILVGLSFVGSIGLWVFDLAEGYFANPALLGLATPLFIIPVALFCLLVPVVYVVRGIAGRKDRRQVVMAGIALVALLWRGVTPGIPENVDAFHYRMSQFEESEYDQLFSAVQAELHRIELNPDSGPWDQRNALYPALAETHPMLAIGPYQPKVSFRFNRMSVHWGGGLTGAYFVIVYGDSSERSCESTPSSEVRCLYDNVMLSWVT